MIHVAVINKSKLVSNDEVRSVANALNKQAKHEFYDGWGIYSAVYFYTSESKIPHDYYWRFYILDESDVQGALGYHDFETSIPTAKIFVKTSKDDGVSWSSVASHELLEMLVDSEGVCAALNEDTAIFYSYEVCDPVQNDTYSIDGIEVSNFVYPSWFSTGGKTPYDYQKVLSKPFTLAKGGYTSTLDVSHTQGWKEITARSRFANHIEDDN